MEETQTKVALIGVIVEDMEATDEVNELLHEFNSYIIGRMGIPYREKEIGIISIVLDAPEDKISALSGKLGMVRGITVKSMTTKQKN